MFRIVCLLIGYCFGCVQTAYITGKIKANIDVRQHGSGNAGTSNVIRVLGRSAGLIVFVSDVLKAIAAFALCAWLFRDEGAALLPGLYGGVGVVLGHDFPAFLRFKGGKGIASTLGLMLILDWRAALIAYVIGATLLALTRYISLASLTMLLLAPFLLLLFGHGAEIILLMAILAALAFYLHRGNIQRLLSGTERKLSLKKAVKP